MITKVFSIFDVKADAFNTPFFAPSNGIAIRQFSDLANDPQSTVNRHAADFKLVCIGSYNDQLGLLEAEAHQSLGFATEYIKQSNVSPLKVAP